MADDRAELISEAVEQLNDPGLPRSERRRVKARLFPMLYGAPPVVAGEVVDEPKALGTTYPFGSGQQGSEPDG